MSIDLTSNANYGDLANFTGAHQNQKGFPTVVSRKITCTSTYKLLAATSGGYKLFYIPAGCIVKDVSCHVVTAEGATATVDIGDSGSGTQYLSNFDLNGTAGTGSLSAVGVTKYYASANGIYADPDNDLDAAVFIVTATIIYPQGY
jgi:hypothetical protein